MAVLIPGVGLVESGGALLIPGAGLLDLGPALVTLTVADAVHGHSVDNLAPVQANMLAVADALHSQVADGVTLSQAHVLAIANALHTHVAENAELSQQYTLVVNNALHAQLADLVSLSLAGDELAGAVFVVEARDRIYLVATRSRHATVSPTARTYTVQ